MQAFIGAGNSDLGEACAQRRLPGDEGRAAGGAALLRVVVGEHHAFVGDAIDIGGLIPRHPVAVDAEVGGPDIVGHDHEDIRFLRLGLHRGHKARGTKDDANRGETRG